jgi:hypothetical protein
MVPEGLQGSPRRSRRTRLPAELECALRNCGAALRSLGAAEERVSRQLAALQADRAALAQKPFTPMRPRESDAGVRREADPSSDARARLHLYRSSPRDSFR